MNLSSRPNAPFALWLATDLAAFAFNGHAVANGGAPADTQTLWEAVRQAWRWWDVDVVAGTEPAKPHVGIAFAPAFGYPGGGQANVGAWQQGGIQAVVFTDVNQYNALYCGLDAVHESGHLLGGFADIFVNGIYTPGFWMGMPLGNPQWTPEQRAVLDGRFGVNSDLNFDGKVDMQDAQRLRQDGFDAAEAIDMARSYGRGG